MESVLKHAQYAFIEKRRKEEKEGGRKRRTDHITRTSHHELGRKKSIHNQQKTQGYSNING